MQKDSNVQNQIEQYRNDQETRRREAGEMFDRYLLLIAGGGFYFGITVYKYVAHAAAYDKWMLIVGVFFLMIAAILILENNRLLYQAYTLRRDEIDDILYEHESGSGNRDNKKQAKRSVILDIIDPWVVTFNAVSRFCLYIGITLVFAAFVVASL